MASTIRGFNLECGAFSIPVALKGASERKDVRLDKALKVETPVGVEYRRIKQLNVSEPEADAESLVLDPLLRDRKGQVKAKQYDEDAVVYGCWEGDEFIEIERHLIDEIDALTTLDPLVVQEFVPLVDVPWERVTGSYFLAPGAETLGVLRALVTFRDGLARNKVAAVGKLMPKGRQKLAVVYPKHGGLMVSLLAYADTYAQVLDGGASMEGVVASEEALTLMDALIAAKAAPVSALDEYRDDLIDLRGDLIDRAKLGRPLRQEGEVPEPVETLAVTVGGEDKLLAALRASVDASKKKKRARKPAKGSRPASARKTAGRS